MTEEINEVAVEEEVLDDSKITAFIIAYLKTWNRTEAYLSVHPESTRVAALSNSYRYWNNKKVQTALKLIMDDAMMGKDEIGAILTNLARGGTGIKKAEQLKAIELIMKSKGMFLDRIDVTTQGNKISWEQIISEDKVSTKSNYGNITTLG